MQVAEQEFFLSQGYMNGKSRCKECTRAKKARFGEASDAASRRLERQGKTCAPDSWLGLGLGVGWGLGLGQVQELV